LLNYKTREKLLKKAIQKGSSELRAWRLEHDSESFRVYHFNHLIGGYNFERQEFFSTHKGWSVTDCNNLKEFIFDFHVLDERTPSLSNVKIYRSLGIFGLPFLMFESLGKDGLCYVDGVYGFHFPRPESYVFLSCPRMTIKEVEFWGGMSYNYDKKKEGGAYFPQSVLNNPDFIKRVLILQIKYYKNYSRELYNYLKPEDQDEAFQTYINLNSIKYGWGVKIA